MIVTTRGMLLLSRRISNNILCRVSAIPPGRYKKDKLILVKKFLQKAYQMMPYTKHYQGLTSDNPKYCPIFKSIDQP